MLLCSLEVLNYYYEMTWGVLGLNLKSPKKKIYP